MNATMSSFDSPKVESRDTANRGRGLFAKRPIAQGEFIVVTLGQIVHWTGHDQYNENLHVFQIETDTLIAPVEDNIQGIFSVNHSCDPNAGIRGQISLVAIRPIQQDEEICYDYAMTDSDYYGKEIFQMTCLCGSPMCRKSITDKDWLRADLRDRYKGYFSSYLAARIRNE